MGLTLPEALLVAAGALLLSAFLFRTAGPLLRLRIEGTARRRSSDLREEFMAVSPRRVLVLLAAAGAVAGAFVAAAAGSIAWGAAAAAVPLLLSGLAVRAFRSRRRRMVIDALPGLLDLLAGHLKAGHSLQEALRGALPHLSGGVREEVAWLAQLVKLGTPLPEALLLWEQRMPCEEIALVARPLRAAIPLGGNVAELLGRLRNVIRAKLRTEDKMRSMTAQARLQAVVLTLLPPAFLGVLSRIDPGFLPRCLGSSAGQAILAAAALLQILGWIVIRKILSARP